MAIQFQCPQCGAAIRVPDTAAGKKGRCPQCGQPLLVPVVEPSAAPPADAVVPDAGPQFPNFGTPDDHTTPPALPAGPSTESGGDPFAFLPDAGAPPPVPAERTSIARQLRRRQRFRAGRLIVPLLLGAVLVGAGLWLFWESRPKMEGPLPAVRLDMFGPVTQTIEPGLIDLPRDRMQHVLEEMQTRPLPSLLSGLMTVDLKATDAGLQVQLQHGRETAFYRVDPAAQPAVRDFLKEHQPRLNTARLDQLGEAAASFVRDWRQAADEGIAMDATAYRDSLALAALSGGLGYHLQAVTASGAYRAVYQDDDGRVYFLLPRSTRSFRLEGRPLEDGRVLFPGEFQVTVVEQKPPTTPLPAEPAPEASPVPDESQPPAAEKAMDSAEPRMPGERGASAP